MRTSSAKPRNSFTSIFSPIIIEHGWKRDKPLMEIVDECSDDEVIEIHGKLDCYQIDSRMFK